MFPSDLSPAHTLICNTTPLTLRPIPCKHRSHPTPGTGRGKAQARAPLRQAHSRATSTASTNASISSSSVASSSTLRVPSAAKAAGPARHAIPLAEPLDPYPYSAPLHTGWGDTGRQDEGEGEGEDEDEGEDDGEEEEEEEAGEFDVDESCPSYPSSPLDDELDDALPDGQSAWAMKVRGALTSQCVRVCCL